VWPYRSEKFNGFQRDHGEQLLAVRYRRRALASTRRLITARIAGIRWLVAPRAHPRCDARADEAGTSRYSASAAAWIFRVGLREDDAEQPQGFESNGDTIVVFACDLVQLHAKAVHGCAVDVGFARWRGSGSKSRSAVAKLPTRYSHSDNKRCSSKVSS